MPFTLAHPAAVLPLKAKFAKYFDLTGLVLGSMAPDFEYFIRFRPEAVIGHKIIGFLLLNLPLCFVIAFLVHKIIKKPFIMSMPSPIDRWYSYMAHKDWRLRGFKGVIVFIYSSLLGMITHVLWDAFTHENGRFVSLFLILSVKVHIWGYSFPIYKILQHGSTLLGVTVICLFLLGLRDEKAVPANIKPCLKVLYFLSILLCSVAFILIGLLLSSFDLSFKSSGVAVVVFINGIFSGCLLVSVLYNRVKGVDGNGQCHKKSRS
ncbi:MAG TPA: DUF4184 family protein [Clostridia bacterium]